MKIKNFHIKKLTKQELLAYEIGVHLGDGCLFVDKNHGTFRNEFSGDSKNDKEFYSMIFPEIFEKVYNKKLKIYKKMNENTIIAVINSKEIALQKLSLGIPSGNKLNLQKVPVWINGNLIHHFIRGLADADFSVSFKKNKKGIHCEPRIEFFTNNKVLAKFVYKNLKKIGFNPAFEDAFKRNFREFRIRMYGKKMLKEWMDKIGFFNSKHLSKIYLFEKFGYVKPYLTTQERISFL